MEKLKTMEYYILQTHKIIKENYENKELTNELTTLFLKKDYKSIKIIASGSSGNAVLCAKYLMEEILAIPVDVISPFTFAHYPLILENDFIFAISQSGYSCNVLEALTILKKYNRDAIALTGDMNSDIKDYADFLIEYGVGEEVEGYVTKGVTTLVLFLLLFALDVKKRRGDLVDLKKYDLYFQEYESMQKINFKREVDFIEKFKKNFLSMDHCYVVGCGIGEGIAKEAALKIGETVKIVTCSYELEEYIHGPNLQLSPCYNVFIIDSQDDTSNRSYQIYLASRQVSDRVYYITNKEMNDDHVLTLLNPEPNFLALSYLQFFQLLSYRISKELCTIPKHPLMKDFNKIVSSKTINYDD